MRAFAFARCCVLDEAVLIAVSYTYLFAQDENEEGMFNGNFSWAAEDEEFINSLEVSRVAIIPLYYNLRSPPQSSHRSLDFAVQRFVQDNDEIVNGRDRKARNRLFKAIERGDFGSLADDDMVIDPVFGMGSMPAAKRELPLRVD